MMLITILTGLEALLSCFSNLILSDGKLDYSPYLTSEAVLLSYNHVSCKSLLLPD